MSILAADIREKHFNFKIITKIYSNIAPKNALKYGISIIMLTIIGRITFYPLYLNSAIINAGWPINTNRKRI